MSFRCTGEKRGIKCKLYFLVEIVRLCTCRLPMHAVDRIIGILYLVRFQTHKFVRVCVT